jgi:prephenate dehydrogenase
LFLENKTALVEKIDDFMTVLKDLKSDIINDDEKSLKEKLIEARKRRLNFDENNTTKL